MALVSVLSYATSSTIFLLGRRNNFIDLFQRGFCSVPFLLPITQLPAGAWMCKNIMINLDISSFCVAENLMVGYRMVFDRENLKLGWSKSKCKHVFITINSLISFFLTVCYSCSSITQIIQEKDFGYWAIVISCLLI